MLIYTTTFSNHALEIDYYFLLAFSSFFTMQVTTVSPLQTLIHAFSDTLVSWLRWWCNFTHEYEESKVSSVNLFCSSKVSFDFTSVNTCCVLTRIPTDIPYTYGWQVPLHIVTFPNCTFHHFSKFYWTNWARIIQEDRNSVLLGGYAAALIFSFSEALFYLIHCIFCVHILKSNDLGISETTSFPEDHVSCTEGSRELVEKVVSDHLFKAHAPSCLQKFSKRRHNIF